MAVNQYYTTAYSEIAAEIAGSVASGDYLALISIASRRAFEAISSEYARRQLESARQALDLIDKLAGVAGMEKPSGSLEEFLKQGPEYLAALIEKHSEDQPTLKKLLDAANTIHNGYGTWMAGIEASHQRVRESNPLGDDFGIVVAAFKTADQALKGLRIVKAKLESMENQVKPVADFVNSHISSSALRAQIDELAEQLAPPDALSAEELEAREVEKARLQQEATDAQRLKAAWMHARDMLEYLPGALQYFETDTVADVAKGCKSYVTMSSAFMTAIGGKDFIKSNPDSRTCMKIDRMCFSLDTSCSGPRKKHSDSDSCDRSSSKPDRSCECTIM
jgi:hypothetical protein